MQASSNVRQTPPGRRAGRGSSVLLALLAALVVSLFALLESERPTQAIVGGMPANQNPAGWAYIEVKTSGSVDSCGGSLIDANSVLTAAHCVDEGVSEGDISLTIGAVELDVGQGVVRDVTKISICCNSPTPDENYPATGARKYDAAVLTLNQPVTGPNFQPLPLATSTQAGDSLEAAGRKATIVGWGLTKNCDPMTDNSCRPSKQLKWLQVTILGDKDARTELSGVPIKFQPDLMVAAAAPSGSGPCGGDSGGPLFHENYARETGTIIGIYSYGRCANTVWGNLPDMYTEVNNRTIRKFITDAASK